ncbi:unnamed protein product [Diabrotica balteata]|uniref:Uncharacterized protein n=1 Tax=Diabrotica balteata TaxID=107213 RepID=A0A9N9SLV7_DIABA|nr:unnamed protein product [Diabrotica balteata]
MIATERCHTTAKLQHQPKLALIVKGNTKYIRTTTNAGGNVITDVSILEQFVPATAMFSKFKGGSQAQCPTETNPIGQFFEIGKQVASAGPELVWKIHDAYRKSDGKVAHGGIGRCLEQQSACLT